MRGRAGDTAPRGPLTGPAALALVMLLAPAACATSNPSLAPVSSTLDRRGLAFLLSDGSRCLAPRPAGVASAAGWSAGPPGEAARLGDCPFDRLAVWTVSPDHVVPDTAPLIEFGAFDGGPVRVEPGLGVAAAVVCVDAGDGHWRMTSPDAPPLPC